MHQLWKGAINAMSKTKNSKGYLIGLAVAVLVPLSFYFVGSLHYNTKFLPRFYIAEGLDSHMVKGKIHYDTVYHKVGDLRLTNQLGQLISTDSTLKDKILVIDFFFVNCASICPRLTRNMGLLQKAYSKNTKIENSLDTAVQLLSITVNPSHDSAKVLRDYADKHNANHDHWWFLTGDKKVIYNFARNELFVSVQPGDGGDDDFIHTEKIVLVDKNRHIRGYYNGLDSMDLRRCADDIGWLTLEKEKK